MHDAPETTQPAWPSPDRYARHRALRYASPGVSGQRPWLIELAKRRLPVLLARRSGRLPWEVKAIRIEGAEHRGARAIQARAGGHRLHHHGGKKLTLSGAERLRRDQIIKTVDLYLSYLLDRLNVQPTGAGTGSRRLTWLEVREFAIEGAAEALGLSRSTVAEADRLLRECGLLRSEPQRIIDEEGRYRQRPSRRWLTPHLFALLGLSRLYTKQLSYRPRKSPKPGTGTPTGRPGAAPSLSDLIPAVDLGPDATPNDHLDALSALLGRRRKTQH